MIKKSWLFIVGFFLLTLVCAMEVPNYQNKYVNDFAGVLSISQVSELKSLFANVDQNTTAEIVFVSVEECAPYAPIDLSYQIGSKWKVGKENKDNGVVALYCRSEKKFAVSVGYGLEGILPDSKIGRMLDENYVPLRDSGNISQGIVLFLKEISSVVVQNGDEVRSGNGGADNGFLFYMFMAIVIIIIILKLLSFVLGIIYKNRTMPWIFPIILRSGGSSGGGSFGGGGFGGGSFGGGGASR
jgi:uncharacterized protein